jgi:hypothetical protein
MTHFGLPRVNSAQFEIDSWTGAQLAFGVKSFYKNNDSYVAAQREFRMKFAIHRRRKMRQLVP